MSNDLHLQRDVLAELNWEPGVTASHIGVAVSDGSATLTGHVETLAEKHAAEAAARRVKGIKGVVVEIEVRLRPETERDDAAIATAAVERLAWDVSVPPDSVQVTVENGWITLTGEVDWHYQRAAAEQILSRLHGVVGVTNEVAIRSKLQPVDISDEIMHALHRSWFFDPKTINVTTEGGTVRLTGTVHSAHERQVAAATAWSAPGVTDVENEVVIV